MRSLLIPLTYFCLQTWLGITQAEEHRKLSMMENVSDDQYIECDKDMDGIADKLIQSEMSPFSPIWEKAKDRWNHVKRKISCTGYFKDEYGIAIVAYTDHRQYQGKVFPTIFNKEVRSQTADKAKFQFKAFHYYLTRGLQLFRKKYSVTYRGTDDTFDGSGLMRFGQFASSSTNRKEAEKFGTTTVFTIYTYFGVEIQGMSYNPRQEEVLIPGYEIFNVVKKEENNIILKSINQICSHFNCGEKNNACVNKSGEKNGICVYNSAARRGLAFPSELSRSLFGGSVILVHVAALKLFASF